MYMYVYSNADFGTVRAIIRNHEPWFKAKDLAEILEYKDCFKFLSHYVDKEDKLISNNEMYVSAYGCFCLLSYSKSKIKRDLKRWIFSTVIPNLRKTGAWR